MCEDVLEDGRLPHYVRFHCDVCSGIVRTRLLCLVLREADSRDANIPRIFTTTAFVHAFNAYSAVNEVVASERLISNLKSQSNSNRVELECDGLICCAYS